MKVLKLLVLAAVALLSGPTLSANVSRATATTGNGQTAGADIAHRVPSTTTPPPSMPGTPEGVLLSSTQVQLHWNAATPASGARIVRYDVYLNNQKIASTTTTDFTAPFDPAPSKLQFYSVLAVDNNGNSSPASGEILITAEVPVSLQVKEGYIVASKHGIASFQTGSRYFRHIVGRQHDEGTSSDGWSLLSDLTIDEQVDPTSFSQNLSDFTISVSGSLKLTLSDGREENANWLLDPSRTMAVQSPTTSIMPYPFFNTLPHLYARHVYGGVTETSWVDGMITSDGTNRSYSMTLSDEVTDAVLFQAAAGVLDKTDAKMGEVPWSGSIEWSDDPSERPFIDPFTPNATAEMIASRWDVSYGGYVSTRYDEWGYFRWTSSQRGLLHARWLEVFDSYATGKRTILADREISLFGGDGGVQSTVVRMNPSTDAGGGDTYVCQVPTGYELDTPSVHPSIGQPRLYDRDALFVGQSVVLDIGPTPASPANRPLAAAIQLTGRSGSLLMDVSGDAGTTKIVAVDPAVVGSAGMAQAILQGTEIATGANLMPYLSQTLVIVGLKPGVATLTLHLKNYYYSTDVVKTINVYPVSQLAVDANRDGQIKFATEDNTDATSAASPNRFWLNDDIDRGHHLAPTGSGFSEDEEDDIDSTEAANNNWKPDWQNNRIYAKRDLEDFARLWLSTQGLATAFQPKDNTDQAGADLYLGFQWSPDGRTGSPAIKIYPAAETDGGRKYLGDPTVADQQVNFDYAMKDYRDTATPDITSMNVVGGTDFFVIPPRYFAHLSDAQPKTFFLFEGVSAGKGQLKLVILKNDNGTFTKIGEGPGVWLELKEPHEFVERWSCGDGDRTAVQPVVLESGNSGTFGPPASDEEKDYVLYVHGYNMQEFEKQRWLETTYKRLWHLGYKGRVGGFSWPCSQSGLPFDQSEERSWQAATQLNALLTSLKTAGYHVHLLAHSQGNVAAGEALRQAGANSGIVSTYIASQAAITSDCYNSGGLPIQDWGLTDDNTPNVYLNYPVTGAPYLAAAVMQKAAGRYANFYNFTDFALTGNNADIVSSSYHPGWEVDQRLKPDESLGYHYDGTFSGPVGVGTLHFPNDRFQIFAYCAEARTKALGTEPTGGVFTSFTNLQNFGYADAHLWHSGEFRSFYAARWQYWAQVLTTIGLQPVTP